MSTTSHVFHRIARFDVTDSDSVRPRAKLSPIVWATTSALGTFLAIVVGLLTADKTPTLLPWIVAIVASLAAGALGLIQARESERERVHLLREVATLRERLTTPSIEITEPSEGAGTQYAEMRIRGRVSIEGGSEAAAAATLRNRKLEVVPFVRPLTTTYAPADKWWSQNVATLDEASGEVSGTVRVGSQQYGAGESFKIVLLILPQGFLPKTDTRFDELPGAAVAWSTPRTVFRLS